MKKINSVCAMGNKVHLATEDCKPVALSERYFPHHNELAIGPKCLTFMIERHLSRERIIFHPPTSAPTCTLFLQSITIV